VRMSEMDYNEFELKRGMKGRQSKQKPCSISSKTALKSIIASTKCPHKVALEALAKKPELIKGNYEHYDQVKVFYHFSLTDSKTYESLVAVPNGGKRHARTAAALRAEGVKRSYPDILLDIAKGGYFGLRLELKQEDKKKGKVTDGQQSRLELLHDSGYYSVKAWGHKAAIRAIELYVMLPDTIFKPMVINNDFDKTTS
jgi:rhodanese-related sulfurtransferase